MLTVGHHFKVLLVCDLFRFARVKNVKKIPKIGPYIVAAMDQELLELCQREHIPVFYAQSAEIIGDKQNLGTDPSRQKQQHIGADR